MPLVERPRTLRRRYRRVLTAQSQSTMNTLSVQVEISPETRALLALLTDTPDGRRSVNDAIGRECANITRGHLFDLDAKRHRAHVAHRFYATAARATTYEVLDDGPTVRVSKTGFAQRLYGGVILPVNAKALAIPISPRADGKVPSEFQDLVAIVNPQTKKGVLIDPALPDDPLFALCQRVSQAPDPTVLPTDEQYQTAAASVLALLLATPLAPGAASAAQQAASPGGT